MQGVASVWCVALAAGLSMLAAPASAQDGPAGLSLDEAFDTAVDPALAYQPQLSEPRWVVPAPNLPGRLAVDSANNNLSLAFHGGRLFLAWRTAPTHFASTRSRLYVISSPDLGGSWAPELDVALGDDVREPYLLSVRGRLLLYFVELGRDPYRFEPRVLWRSERLGLGRWTQRERWGGPDEVSWEFKQRRGRVWLTSYRGKRYSFGAGDVRLSFRWSPDGIEWHTLPGANAVVYRGGVSEAAFEFDSGGRLWAVTRNEDGDASGFGSHLVSAPPDQPAAWSFPAQADPNRYDSPRMFRHGRDLYLVARRDPASPFGQGWSWLPLSVRRLFLWRDYSTRPKRTSLYKIDTEGRRILPLVDLPSAGDTAFPAIARLGPHTYLIANYTSPLGDPGMSWVQGQLSPRGTRVYLLMLRFVPQAPARSLSAEAGTRKGAGAGSPAGRSRP